MKIFYFEVENVIMANAPLELSKVYRGNRMSCFDLLASGIQSNWLPQTVSGSENLFPENIPHRIIQYWHSKTLPEDVQNTVDTMRSCNPGFTHYLANDESARAFIYEHYGAEGGRIFDACFHATMRADFWRICNLYEEGGMYVDVDTSAHAPLSHIAIGANFQCMLFYTVGSPWCINNGFIIAQPRHAVIGAILEGVFKNIDQFIKTGTFENIWVETGPGITTMATMKWLAKQFVEKEIEPSQTGILFRDYNVSSEVFTYINLDYKATPEGNWREAKPPE